MNFSEFEVGYDALELHVNNRRQQAELQVKEINIRYEMNNLFNAKRNESNYARFLEDELIAAKIALMHANNPIKQVDVPRLEFIGEDYEVPFESADDLLG
jgi:hypothetical protein